MEAELDLVQAAYSSEEVWIDKDHDHDEASNNIVCRHLFHEGLSATFLLRLDCSFKEPIHISGTVEQTETKSAYAAITKLVEACQTFANEHFQETIASGDNENDLGVFAILQVADAWMQDFEVVEDQIGEKNHLGTTPPNASGISAGGDKPVVIARNMIYSHHIIGKQKRADMKHMASDLQLTGFIKIGWPGLMVIEGFEQDVQYFYDTIRRWQWQYLVLRGEMKDDRCLFPPLQEVTDIAVVANHCRQVGLESLFRTSMKLQPNSQSTTTSDDNLDPAEEMHGALVHVDHMNNAKGYRKWLAKSCRQHGVSLLIRQCFESRPIIIVGLFGLQDSVALVLQQWRCCNVDQDARGRPCRERQMTVLVQGPIPNPADAILLEDKGENSALNTTRDKLETLVLGMTNLPSWIQAMEHLW